MILYQIEPALYPGKEAEAQNASAKSAFAAALSVTRYPRSGYVTRETAAWVAGRLRRIYPHLRLRIVARIKR